MKTIILVLGWTLRASAAICIVWTAGQVIGGQVDTLGQLLSSVAFHAAFALSGAQLVGCAKRMAGRTAVVVEA